MASVAENLGEQVDVKNKQQDESWEVGPPDKRATHYR